MVKKQGISNKLAWWYVKSGWFEHIFDGAYCFSGDSISWAGAIASVLRGCVFEPEIMELVDAAQVAFLQTQKVKTVSLADLYAGKICAALDRQHPHF